MSIGIADKEGVFQGFGYSFSRLVTFEKLLCPKDIISYVVYFLALQGQRKSGVSVGELATEVGLGEKVFFNL